MSASRCVQHKSGQGERWPLMGGSHNPESDVWIVRAGTGRLYTLPRSEYLLVPSPDDWRDVTQDCAAVLGGDVLRDLARDLYVDASHGYRLRKVELWTSQADQQWAFVIERQMKKP